MEISVVKKFQEKLLNSTSAKHGEFGELIYSQYLQNKKIDFKKLHSNGIDFYVEGVGNVDLKTRKLLKYNFHKKISIYKGKIQNVIYVYLILYQEKMLLMKDINNKLEIIDELQWADYESIMADFLIADRNELGATEIKNYKNSIKNWVYNNWGLKAKVISRCGLKAQEAFERNGWGPNNFYTNPSKTKFDMTVLVYFDGSNIYKIYAYPVKHFDLIDWFPKNKGPNVNDVMIFDPNKLGEVYKFKSLEEFKSEYTRRFI